jgi:hypothetical protein
MLVKGKRKKAKAAMSRRLDAHKQRCDPKQATLRFVAAWIGSVLFFSMIPGRSQTTEWRICSQTLNTVTQDKEDGFQELMEKLQLDLIFLSESFRASLENSRSQLVFLSQTDFCTIEMTNSIWHRDI